MGKAGGQKILAFNGSPRPTGNSSHLLESFLEGARGSSAETEVVHSHLADLDYCTGCLRCNVLKRCSVTSDGWSGLSAKILDADVLVFAAPVYFHHLPAAMKKMMDRFRSFVHVQITETGLEHTPWQRWDKDFVLLLSMGSPDPGEAEPVIDLFRFITTILGSKNRLHVITATRMAVIKQVIKSEQELNDLYVRLKLPGDLARADYMRNRKILEECRNLGSHLAATRIKENE